MNLRLFAVVVLTGTVLLSCGFGRMATGVVIWAPEVPGVQNGDLVWIWEQSRIRHSLKIQPANGSASLETDQWRVKSFSSESDAKAFSQSYQQYRNTFAVSGKQGLPVRQTPDANANRLYKLGENEEVKVLSRPGQRVKQGNLEGTWVEVLTKDGYSGWVFDYYLKLIERTPGAIESVKNSGPGDEKVQLIVSTSWYPEEMRAMVDQNRLRPEIFRPELGLRLTGSADTNRSFLLTLPSEAGPDELFELPWDEPRKIDELSYYFGGSEKLRIQFSTPELSKISIGFTWKGQEKNVTLATLQGDVGTLLSQELASRQRKWTELTNHGHLLESPTYGKLSLGEENSFTWEGFQALSPPSADILPDNLPHLGKITFDWFKDRKLTNEFQAIRFVFGEENLTPGAPEPPSQVFLYRFLKDGLQLLPVLPRDTDQTKHTVLRESKSGLSVFFTFQN